MRRTIFVVRQPWTSDFSETFQSRILETYLMENFPGLEINYVGRDFPLQGEGNFQKPLQRNIFFTGNLTNDALHFLGLQPQISTLVGVQIRQNLSPVRGRLGMRQLFLSETFRREFSRYSISTQDDESHNFLENFGIRNPQIGSASILLGTLKKSLSSTKETTQILLLDLSESVLDAMAQESSDSQKLEVFSSKISEFYGEIEKNLIFENLVNRIMASGLVITTNPIYVTGALSLGKKVIFISETKEASQNFMNFSEDEFIKYLRTSNVFDISFSLSLEEIHEKQFRVANFLKLSLENSIESNLAHDATAYANQVISEVINSILESEGKLQTRNSQLELQNSQLELQNSQIELQIHGLMESRSWRATEPLRWVHAYIRKLTGRD
jgi:hypothetical protein